MENINLDKSSLSPKKETVETFYFKTSEQVPTYDDDIDNSIEMKLGRKDEPLDSKEVEDTYQIQMEKFKESEVVLEIEDEVLEIEDDVLEIEDEVLEIESDSLEIEDEVLEIEDEVLEIESDALEIESDALEIESDSLFPVKDSYTYEDMLLAYELGQIDREEISTEALELGLEDPIDELEEVINTLMAHSDFGDVDITLVSDFEDDGDGNMIALGTLDEDEDGEEFDIFEFENEYYVEI